MIVFLPKGPDGSKVGLDDYLLTHSAYELGELVVIALRGEEERQQEAEELARRRRPGCGHDCSHPRAVILKKLPGEGGEAPDPDDEEDDTPQDGSPNLVMIRCERCWDLSCEGCRWWGIEREVRSALHHWKKAEGEGKRLYELRVGLDEKEWEAARKKVRRAGGRYLAATDRKDWLLVTDAEVEGASAVTALEAAERLRRQLQEYQGKKRPVRACRAWPRLRPAPSGNYRLIGQGSGTLTDETVQEIAQAVGAAACERELPGPRRSGCISPVLRWWTFRLPAGREWDEETFQRVVTSLMAGEVVDDVNPFVAPGRGGKAGPGLTFRVGA
jgi:hypothetical protein